MLRNPPAGSPPARCEWQQCCCVGWPYDVLEGPQRLQLLLHRCGKASWRKASPTSWFELINSAGRSSLAGFDRACARQHNTKVAGSRAAPSYMQEVGSWAVFASFLVECRGLSRLYTSTGACRKASQLQPVGMSVDTCGKLPT